MFSSLRTSVILWLWLLASACTAGPTFEPVSGFELGPERPQSAHLLLADDGSFYGTSALRGAKSSGVIYRVTKDGKLSVPLHFTDPFPANGTSPRAGLIKAPDGQFWGTTEGGGAGHGTVFRFDPQTATLTTVVEFNRTFGVLGAAPTAALMLDGMGNVWGVTERGGVNDLGTVFKVNIATGAHSTAVDFTGTAGAFKGRSPKGRLVMDRSGKIWGTTLRGGALDIGTVFRFDPATAEFTTMVEFAAGPAAEGRDPTAGLCLDGMGNLWGTTSQGGPSNAGTVFRIDAESGTFTTTHIFTDTTGLTKGRSPLAELILEPTGSLLGTTWRGGNSIQGSIFRIDPSTRAFTTLASFDDGGPVRGQFPESPLTYDGEGSYWGTTGNGGSARAGTIFKFTPATSTLTCVIELTATVPTGEGIEPHSVLASDGGPYLWGTTMAGGHAGNGTVYKVHAITGERTTVYEFPGTLVPINGAMPIAGVTYDGAGSFWGVTSIGGNIGSGTVFKIDAATSAFTKVLEFTGSSGAAPGERAYGTLTSDGLGYLWGTTVLGGTGARGNIFKIHVATGAFTSVAFLTGGVGPFKGREPHGALFNDGQGYMWGTTSRGGDSGDGTVFKIKSDTHEFTTVVEFAGGSGPTRGENPLAGLVADNAGFLWGTTERGGSNGFGTIYKINRATGAFTSLINFGGFNPARGSFPEAPLCFDGASGFYGTTWGDNNLFRLTTSAQFTELWRFGTFGNVPGDLPSIGGLFRHQDGNFYGTTNGGGVTIDGRPAGGGQIFRLRMGPTPITRPANRITLNSVRLHGTVNPNSESTTWSFEWGTTPALGNTTAVNALSAGTTPLPIFADLGGLNHPATFYYRLKAVNATGTQYGEVLSFSTPTPTPLEDWKLTHFGDVTIPDEDDRDRDGVVALAEYALQRNPLTPDPQSSPLPQLQNYPEGTRLRLIFPRDPARNDVNIEVQSANDPKGPWTTIAASAAGLPMQGEGYVSGDGPGPGVKIVEVRDTVNSAGVPQRTMRLRISR